MRTTVASSGMLLNAGAWKLHGTVGCALVLTVCLHHIIGCVLEVLFETMASAGRCPPSKASRVYFFTLTAQFRELNWVATLP